MNPVGELDHLARARTLYDARRYDFAIASALDAIAADPENVSAHVILSLSYDREGRLREAEASAIRAIGLDPQRSQAHVALGIVRLSQRRYQDALRAFREAVALDAQNDDAFRLAAIAHMNQNHYHDALKEIEKALDIDPDVISTREVHAMILRLLGRQTDAEAATASVLRMHPESVLGLSQHGLLQLQRGEPVRARAAFREALRLEPNSESVRAGYERVVIKSSPYADWFGRRLFVIGVVLLFSSGAITDVNPDLGIATTFTAFVLWIVNRPLAVEALRADEIGRTFVEPAVLARNRSVLLYAAAAEATLFVAVPLHRHAVYATTVGAIMAAVAMARSMRAEMSDRLRAIYIRLAHVLFVSSSLVSIGFMLDRSSHHAKSLSPAETLLALALLVAALGYTALFVLDTIFVYPKIGAAAYRHFRRRR